MECLVYRMDRDYRGFLITNDNKQQIKPAFLKFWDFYGIEKGLRYKEKFIFEHFFSEFPHSKKQFFILKLQ